MYSHKSPNRKGYSPLGLLTVVSQASLDPSRVIPLCINKHDPALPIGALHTREPHEIADMAATEMRSDRERQKARAMGKKEISH